MPPGVYYGMQDMWEKEGREQVTMEFLLPTGIYLSFPVGRSDTIGTIKKVNKEKVFAATCDPCLKCDAPQL